MPMAGAPTLGYGDASEATLDQVNIWMRSTPWYQQLLKSWGQTPNNVHLNDAQKSQIVRAAQANGVVVDEGKQEIDDSGNFKNQGHGLRNTLIVAGIAGAAIATMGAAGVFGAAGASTGAATSAGATAALGPTSAASMAATAASSSVPAGIAASTGGAAALGGLTYADLLKYGLPTAGNLINGAIQSKASSSAADAQQKYLEEALAYEKEKDLYARTTDEKRYADSRGDVAYDRGVKAAAVQYGYDSDEYARAVAAAAVKKEQTRYGDYQGRIAPFIANGVSSNDRMAKLLGLPARTASPWGDGARGAPGGPDAPEPAPVFRGGSGAGPGGTGGTGQLFDPDYIGQQLDAEYAKHGLTATGPGSGPTDKAYFVKAVRGTKEGWDAGYWGPRITEELRKAGIADRPVTTSTTPPPKPLTMQPNAAGAAAPAASGAVTMRAPDGSQQRVPADQVAHYQALGATVIGAAV